MRSLILAVDHPQHTRADLSRDQIRKVRRVREIVDRRQEVLRESAIIGERTRQTVPLKVTVGSIVLPPTIFENIESTGLPIKEIIVDVLTDRFGNETK